MKTLLCILLIIPSVLAQDFTLSEGRSVDRWMNYSRDPEINMLHLFELLSMSKTGREIVKRAKTKAQASGQELVKIVTPGETSLTDTTLIRRFHPNQPDQIEYRMTSVVYINSSLSTQDAILDLAHELHHYVYRQSFNPYQENYNLTDFVQNTIEAEGGEVGAFLTECQVLKELFSHKQFLRSQCRDLDLSLDPQQLFVQARNLFYQVGDYHGQLKTALLKHDAGDLASKLSPNKIKFISSAYGVPYPLAAYFEYQSVMEKVCENDQKRLSLSQKAVTRTVASSDDLGTKHLQKCQKFIR